MNDECRIRKGRTWAAPAAVLLVLHSSFIIHHSAFAVPPADVQRVQADLRNGRPGEWVDVPVTPQVAAAIAAALPAVSPPNPPTTGPVDPPADDARRVPVGQPVGTIRPGERVLIQAGWRRAETLRPAAGSYIGRYGEGPNPTITGGQGVVFQAAAGKTLDGVTVEDLDVVCEQGIEGDPAFRRDRPEWAGFNIKSPVRGLTLRRCLARGFAYGLVVEHQPDVLRLRNSGGLIEDFRAVDNWSTIDFHGQGIYLAAWDDLVVLRPVAINNGYVPGDKGTVLGFHQGLYVQGGAEQWKLAPGCRRVRVVDPVAIHNGGWGVQNRSDGGEVSGGFFAGNAVGLAVSGPLAVRAVGNVVVAGHVCRTNATLFGAGGIDWRAASGELRDSLLVCPPECVPPNKNHRKPAFEVNAARRTGPDDATYVGTVRVTAGGNNASLGWERDLRVWGSNPPGLRAVALPKSIDWGWLDDYERRARRGEATAAEAIGRVRKAVGKEQ